MREPFGQRLRRLRPGRVVEEASRQGRRLRRWLWQRRHLDRRAPRRPVFVVGYGRSGTNMVMWTLERSPEVWPYHEHWWSPAFRDYRLRSTATIERLIRRSPSPIVVFKPICDSHLTDRLLERHSGSRAIWIYRRFQDAASSTVRNWGGHQLDIMRWIVDGDTDWLGWRGERLPSDLVELAHALFRDDMSWEEAAAFTWLVRNRFFFDLGLDRDPRVLLVRYEDLVGSDEEPFRRLFEFVGVPLSPTFLDHVFSESVGKHAFPPIHPELERRCRALLERLDATLLADATAGQGGSVRGSLGPSGVSQA